MTIWLGQDGFDYNFQLDYGQAWEWEIEGIREVAEHDPECLISIEYKPDEPRAQSLLRDARPPFWRSPMPARQILASRWTSPTRSMPANSPLLRHI